jgi:ATP-dependent RNA helicase RhlE
MAPRSRFGTRSSRTNTPAAKKSRSNASSTAHVGASQGSAAGAAPRKKRHRKGGGAPSAEQLRALPLEPGERAAPGSRAASAPAQRTASAPWKSAQKRQSVKPRSNSKRQSSGKEWGTDKPRPSKPGTNSKPWSTHKPTSASKSRTNSKPWATEKARASSKPRTPEQPQPTAQPAGAAGSFAQLQGVHHRTAEALSKLGIDAPFEIQRSVIPTAVRGSDMLVQSPTGSGKTLAFGIPLIEQIAVGTSQPTALILTPTRELAIQVSEDLTPIARGKQLSVAAAFGGAPIMDQARRVSRAAIVVATPGRIADLMRTRRVDLTSVRMLVLDEADRMLDMGFQPQVDEIVDELPQRRQTLLFSATLEGPVARIAREYTTDPTTVNNAVSVGGSSAIEHILLATTSGTKVDTVLDALHEGERDLAVVFVRTQRGADRLSTRLREYGVRSTAIHGGMSQGQRQREYRRFQTGTCDTLVATDVFARGMDLDRISHVINYDIPEDADTYRHRAGRTGRAGRAGTAVTMVLPNQRRAIKAMIREAGLPAELADRIRPASGRSWHQVPEGDRFSEQRASAGDPAQQKGTVAAYDDAKGFGFITPDSGSSDVFFHRSAVMKDSGYAIARGARVEFDPDTGADRERAGVVRLTGPGERRGGQNNRPATRGARNGRPTGRGSQSSRPAGRDDRRSNFGTRNGERDDRNTYWSGHRSGSDTRSAPRAGSWPEKHRGFVRHGR